MNLKISVETSSGNIKMSFWYCCLEIMPLFLLGFHGLRLILVRILVLIHLIIVKTGETETSSNSPKSLKNPQNYLKYYVHPALTVAEGWN